VVAAEVVSLGKINCQRLDWLSHARFLWESCPGDKANFNNCRNWAKRRGQSIKAGLGPSAGLLSDVNEGHGMTSLERTWARLDGKPVDRLPALPIFMTYAGNLIGQRYDDYCRDHRILVEGNLAMVERYGIDLLSCCCQPFSEAADCGAELEYYDNQPPSCRNHLLKEPADLLTLKRPDPHGGGLMTERIKAIELYKKTAGDTIPIQGWVEGPMAQASDLRGINEIMLETVTNPEFALDLMDWVTEMEIEFAQAQITAGANLIGIGDAAASLVNPTYYADEVAPREKKIVDAIHDAGARVRLHICGSIQGKYEAIKNLGVDLLDIDYLQTVAEVREGTGSTQCLSGNIDPVRGIKDSTPRQIRADFAKAHEEAGENFILAAGCEVPPETPEENVVAMFDYARSAS